MSANGNGNGHANGNGNGHSAPKASDLASVKSYEEDRNAKSTEV